MVKIFLLAMAVWLVITILKNYLKNLNAPAITPAGKSEKSESEKMEQCAYCGTHIPASDSFLAGGQYYCNEAHSKAAQAAPPKP